MHHAMVAAAVAFAAGIGVSELVRPHPVLPAMAIVWGLVAAGARRRARRPRWQVWALLAVAGAGALRYGWVRYRGPGLLGRWLDQPAELVGTLREVRLEEGRWQAVLQVEAVRSPEGAATSPDTGPSSPEENPSGPGGTPWQRAEGRVWLRYRFPEGQRPGPLPREGDRVQVAGRIDMPERANWPGQFDRQEYLARQGVFLKLELRAPPTVAGKGRLPWPLALAQAVRERLRAVLEQTLPAPKAALLAGLILGWREGIPPAWAEAFRRTGGFHALAASGANVAFVVTPFRRLVGWAGLGPRWSAVLSIAVAWAYCLLAGADPPVARAALMATLYYMGEAQGRPTRGTHSLAVAGLVMLGCSPGLLFDVGFQLSFAATLGILTLAAPLDRWLRARLPGFMAGPLAVTLAAGAAVEPLLLHHFGALSLISPIANLWVAVVAEAAVTVGTAGLVAGLLLPPVARPVLDAVGWLLEALVQPVVGWSHAPGAYLELRSLPWTGVALWYGLLTAWGLRGCLQSVRIRLGDTLRRALAGGLGPGGQRIRRGSEAALRNARFRVGAGLPLGALLMAVIPLGWALGRILPGSVPLAGSGTLAVHFLDVGQGDAILLRFPGGRTMLVDGGGAGEEAGVPFDAGRQRVLPALRRLGIRRLDWVVATHADLDHVGGLPAVVQAIPVGEVWTPAAAGAAGDEGPGERALLAAARSRGVPVRAVAAGDRLEPAPGVRVEVLNPGPFSQPTRNGRSVVFSVAYGQQAFLLTADLDRETEARLVDRAGSLRASVLKVGHHGSATSTGPEWLQAVGARVAVISVGTNAFGHPAPEVVDRLRQAGVRIYRTDRQGTVSFLTDGVRLYVTTARNPWSDRWFRWFGAW